MPRRTLYMLAALCLFFVFGTIGASTINLLGSDPAPGEGRTQGQCFSGLTVDAPPVSGNGNGNDLKVVHVYVRGNFDGCVGSWMRVTAQLNPTTYAYAVMQIGTVQNEYEFTFDDKTGDFRSETPVVVNGGLVPSGKLEAPPKKLDIAAINVVIAATWE